MAPRSRQSQAATSSGRRAVEPSSLPPYEPPAFPLNHDAQARLDALLRNHSLHRLKKHYADAGEHLTTAAGLINDRLVSRQDRHKRRQARRAQRQQAGADIDDDAESEEELEQIQAKVDDMTQRMEESMRRLIDGQLYVSHIEDNINHVRQQSSLAQSASQRTSQRRRRRADVDSDDEDNDMDFEPTLPSSNGRRNDVQGPSRMLQDRLTHDKNSYQTLDHRTRYANNNNYIGFRRVVWDAQNPGEEAPPLPHPSTWFTSQGSPAPGVTSKEHSRQTRAGGAAQPNEDSDDDIAIARERISTKCPLTLREFVDPVTSKKCPHSFEREAILALIHDSTIRTGGSGRRGARDGEKTVQCPVPGCQVLLTAVDLAPDPLLIRKIRRIQHARTQLSRSPSPVDGSARRPGGLDNPDEIISSDVDDIDALERAAGADRRVSRARSIKPKQEPRSSAVRRTVINNAGEDDDEDDDMEE